MKTSSGRPPLEDALVGTDTSPRIASHTPREPTPSVPVLTHMHNGRGAFPVTQGVFSLLVHGIGTCKLSNAKFEQSRGQAEQYYCAEGCVVQAAMWQAEEGVLVNQGSS